MMLSLTEIMPELLIQTEIMSELCSFVIKLAIAAVSVSEKQNSTVNKARRKIH